MRRLLAAVPFAVVALHAACSSEATPTSALEDAGSTGDASAPDAKSPADAAPDATTTDSGCPTPKTTAATGETCTGFGKTADPCDPACGLPAYGYLCFNGGPPGFTGCVQVRASSFGDTYCCPKNDCVAEPDQDTRCAGVAGKPHLYQCPPDGTDGGSVAPPALCVSRTVAGSPYAYHCCP